MTEYKVNLKKTVVGFLAYQCLMNIELHENVAEDPVRPSGM